MPLDSSSDTPFTCRTCGQEFRGSVWHCPRCNAHQKTEIMTCPRPSCGYALGGPGPAAAPTEEGELRSIAWQRVRERSDGRVYQKDVDAELDIVRSEQGLPPLQAASQPKACPTCGAVFIYSVRHCGQCGMHTISTIPDCEHCGAPMPDLVVTDGTAPPIRQIPERQLKELARLPEHLRAPTFEALVEEKEGIVWHADVKERVDRVLAAMRGEVSQ